jgi:hypothetical protein
MNYWRVVLGVVLILGVSGAKRSVGAAPDSQEAGLRATAAADSGSGAASSDTAAARLLKSRGAKVLLDPDGRVQGIEARRCSLQDADLAAVAGLKHLTWLEIGWGPVTDVGLVHLKRVTSLERLYLHDLDLTDVAMENLAGLANLEALSLKNTRISGKGLVHVVGLKKLQALNLAGTQVDDAGLAHLAGLPKLETVCLEKTRVTGKGLAHLKKLARLRVLNLKECKVASDDLEQLLPARALKMLYLKGTQVTESRARDFKTRMEGLAVYFH